MLGKVLTIAGLVEAVARVAVAREDDDLVATLLQADGRVDHQPFGSANAQVRVQKGYCLAVVRGVFCHGGSRRRGRSAIA